MSKERADSRYTPEIVHEMLYTSLKDAKGHFDSQIAGLKELVGQRFTDQGLRLDERYATQTKALDAAFDAQQAAMNTALTAAKAAVDAALAAAEKAVLKAELADERRFESVNEFRKLVNDILDSLKALIGGMMTREEVDTHLKGLKDSFDGQHARLLERVEQLQGTLGITLPREVFESYALERTKRLDEVESRLVQRIKVVEDVQRDARGRGLGRDQLWAYLLGAAGVVAIVLNNWPHK